MSICIRVRITIQKVASDPVVYSKNFDTNPEQLKKKKTQHRKNLQNRKNVHISFFSLNQCFGSGSA
jgi:hypothetical protein